MVRKFSLHEQFLQIFEWFNQKSAEAVRLRKISSLEHYVEKLAKAFFYKQRFFSTQAQCCLTFSWIQLHMLLWCCLLHITIITLRNILYLVYLCLCLCLILFMSYLCDQFFIFSLIFRPEYNIFLSPDRMPGRNDTTSDKVNFRLGIKQNLFFEKKRGHQEFVWLLKSFGATVRWWISNLGKHMSISI